MDSKPAPYRVSGYIIYAGQLYPAKRQVSIHEDIPLSVFAPSDFPHTLIAQRVTRLPPYRDLRHLIDRRRAADSDQCQYPALESLDCVSLYRLPRGLKMLIVEGDSRAFSYDNIAELSRLNPGLERLSIKAAGDGGGALFPQLTYCRLYRHVGDIPRWVRGHRGISELHVEIVIGQNDGSGEARTDAMGDAHVVSYDLLHMLALEWCQLENFNDAPTGTDIRVELSVADSVFVNLGPGVRAFVDDHDRNSEAVANGSSTLSRYVQHLEIDAHTGTIEIPTYNNVRQLTATCASGGYLSCVTRLTRLERLNLACAADAIVPAEFHYLTRLTELHLTCMRDFLTDEYCAAVMPTLRNLTITGASHVDSLVNLTHLDIFVTEPLSPAIYRLTALQSLYVNWQAPAADANTCCGDIFPPGFSMAFPQLVSLRTVRTIITDEMCSSARPTLTYWVHEMCGKHVPPAEMARYASAITFVETWNEVQVKDVPRALLGLVMRDLGTDHDLTPHYESAADALASLGLPRPP